MHYSHYRRQKKRSWLFAAGIVPALVIVIGGFIVYSQYQYHTSTPVSEFDNKKRQITIASGEGVAQITDSLIEQNIIENKWVFWLYLKIHNKAAKIKAGNHYISRSQTIPEIVHILTRDSKEQISITIPEGFTLAQIDALLTDKKLIDAGDLIECAKLCGFGTFAFLPQRQSPLEGYVYPDTYFVDPEEFVVHNFLKRTLENFDKRTADIQADIEGSKRSLDEVINMASMIERESNTEEESFVVSGILWKRLDSNVHLGVDATTRYELDNWSDPLTHQDFQSDSPYNTRKSLGLPPTPISNPGLASITAATKPEKSAYWYYLHDKEGSIHYSKNLEEHNQKKYKYLR